MTERLVRMFSAATVELDDVHRFAKEKGMISGTLHRPKNPPASAKGKEKAVEGVQKQKSWWVMVGNREPIEHILQLQHRDDAGLSPMPTAPGYFHEHTYSRPSGCWFLEITGACCITAVFVCLALAYMPGRDN
ncbi:hypothetical protein PUNSTDRAFT_112642 [Punctularia strigosozonata HHB-11173 SS5]|uniref:uncharacterized protein n=1 Tax=Punctularia strigosozonata (strain HHB-11173) TaxID=741275 RepID=UPI0004416DCE|nr:uncharacterized protein PUNSTDRAFT_112642 [Punctularia strigosozonata HHB-11173 SS5]EIN10841.1 hypothetical protein PUNSTDRAFT_112642 [Punctularia strigosozonata HHB-11173 SS5]